MPLIRIDVPEGVSTDIKKQIHGKVREVVLKTLAPKWAICAWQVDEPDLVTSSFYNLIH